MIREIAKDMRLQCTVSNSCAKYYPNKKHSVLFDHVVQFSNDQRDSKRYEASVHGIVLIMTCKRVTLSHMLLV